MVEQNDILGSPLAILACALTYVIEADNRTTFEEKAKMLTVLGKHVGRGEMTETALHQLAADAYEFSLTMEVEHFIDATIETLTPAQKMSIIINLYDAMLVDGMVAAGERRVMDRFISRFEVDRNTIRALREVLMLKNDTGLFKAPDHPYNEPSYSLQLKLVGHDTDQPAELRYEPTDKD